MRHSPRAIAPFHLFMWPFIRYWLYVGHRWLGIGACLLFAIWFVSGLVMTIVGFPTLDATARRAALIDIDWSRVKISPNELLLALPLERYPRELTLEMLSDRPVYRISDWDGSRRVVSAERIESVADIDAIEATKIASAYANRAANAVTTIERDQWTIPEGYIALRPLHKVSINDELGTQVYVSAATGEVVLATTRSQRFWNWLGSVPHWIYFTELRANQPLWRQINLWVSGPAILVALSGIWIGVLRLRVVHRYRRGSRSPYHGWKLWHHWLGIIGGLFLLTWIVSGWLSVNPNQWLSGGWPTTEQWLAYSGHRSLSHPARLEAMQREAAKQASFYYVAGEPVVRLRGNLSDKLVDANTGEKRTFDDVQLFRAVQNAMPQATLIEQQRIEADDLYWYSHHDKRPLPILRAIFDDSAKSWFHINPATAQIVDFSDAGSRRYRWWFNALHRWDFSWLLSQRPLWYGLIWTFALSGLALSITGVVIGWRRVRRKVVVGTSK